jgi:hypothetical protein
MGLDLVSVHDALENEFASSTAASIVTDVWWIGLSDRDKQGVWVLSDGSPLSYTDWAEGQPDDHLGQEHCAELLRFYSAFTWNDAPCAFQPPRRSSSVPSLDRARLVHTCPSLSAPPAYVLLPNQPSPP